MDFAMLELHEVSDWCKLKLATYVGAYSALKLVIKA